MNARILQDSLIKDLVSLFREKQLPYLIVWNKCDLLSVIPAAAGNEIYVSATQG